MATARASRAYSGSVYDAERRWYDTTRWPMWIDGLDRVISVDGDWPRVGSSVRWESAPAGRGLVRERVIGYGERVGQTLEVELQLDYRIKKASILTPVVDFVFIRRAMSRSLAWTLERFGAEMAPRGRARPQRVDQ